ncbi:hypothetical protein MLP_02680 [Microlunatus phosphovorus NM-1]|uniref:Uncharacterized protein n=1 Tax=Microlunatus phosphovorus (strain ATCC 700054 / DSM 10555 / JCM 9379 / NBRC 101784 / NCIMB 13414 / VKM Ac-1990 / NM-1) TaxID=1032480 RepID=F5XHY7_MICPN|nr:hypothetical protein MLP_02680 [Microlunatus phosphovorus NM-1]
MLRGRHGQNHLGRRDTQFARLLGITPSRCGRPPCSSCHNQKHTGRPVCSVGPSHL